MQAIKCNACGLVNAAYNVSCRRCRQDLRSNPLAVLPSGADKGSSYFPYVLVAVVTGVAALVIFGFYRSFNYVSATDDRRIERQQEVVSEALESQRQAAQEQMPTIKPLMLSNANFVDIRKIEQKAIQPALDKMQKENDRMRENAAKAEEYRIRSLPPPPPSH